jgi:hypothetical protein
MIYPTCYDEMALPTMRSTQISCTLTTVVLPYCHQLLQNMFGELCCVQQSTLSQIVNSFWITNFIHRYRYGPSHGTTSIHDLSILTITFGTYSLESDSYINLFKKRWQCDVDIRVCNNGTKIFAGIPDIDLIKRIKILDFHMEFRVWSRWCTSQQQRQHLLFRQDPRL